MNPEGKPIDILLAEDDPDDVILTREALAENRIANHLHVVRDGEELLKYLRKEGEFASEGSAPRPGLILLDLNLPGMDGREALPEIKSDPDLRRIPVVVLTTSKAEEDILKTYDLGVGGFITKPVTFEGFVVAMGIVNHYWFQIVELPSNGMS
jgi:CheY-like chemotaxis protein